MTGLEPAVIWIAGLGFRRIEDCSTEWVLRTWHAGHYRSARERVACTDEPYLGKAPGGVLTVAQSVTSAPLAAMQWQRPAATRTTSHAAPVALVGAGSAALTASAPPTTAPIPLPAAGWFMLAGLTGLMFTRRKT